MKFFRRIIFRDQIINNDSKDRHFSNVIAANANREHKDIVKTS